jgi:methylmalonyl-CoA/ethylmalonyl-CoA epimerase
MSLTLNHIGIAVPSIERFLTENQLFYATFERGPLLENTQQCVRQLFLTDANVCLELLEPLGHPSPLDSFLAKNPRGGLLHLAFDVDDLEAILARIEAAGGWIIVEPVPDVAFDNRRIAFVMLGGQVTELIERRQGH